MLASLIFFVVCHSGPADHFAAFSECLTHFGHEVRLFASGPAYQKLEKLHPAAFDTSNPDALATICAEADFVLSDLGHPFSVAFQLALQKFAPQNVHYVYYDNPEAFVPGEYSHYATQSLKLADAALFANAHLAKEDKANIGIGYYPVARAETCKALRKKNQSSERSAFLKEHGLDDKGEKLLAYFGGNNTVYFSQAFPAFLDIVSKAQLQNTLLVFQQHPGAKAESKDLALLEKSGIKMAVSKWNTDELQIAVDGVLYYQTSLGPQIALADIPLIQVGHEPYLDILVANGLAKSACNPRQLEDAIAKLGQTHMDTQQILEKLGIKKDWPERLNTCFSPEIKHLKKIRKPEQEGGG